MPPPGQPSAPIPLGGCGALAMTVAQPMGAVSTILAMVVVVSRAALEQMTGHGRGRNLLLTVILRSYIIYSERWGDRDTSLVTKRGAMGPSAQEVGNGFADYAEP